MTDEIDVPRRGFFGTAASVLVAAQFGPTGSSAAQSIEANSPGGKATANASFAAAEQIDADGIGHNLPQEAPQAFAQAVIDVAKG